MTCRTVAAAFRSGLLAVPASVALASGCIVGHQTFPPVPDWVVPHRDFEVERREKLARVEAIATTRPPHKDTFSRLAKEALGGQREGRARALQLLKEVPPFDVHDLPLLLATLDLSDDYGCHLMDHVGYLDDTKPPVESDFVLLEVRARLRAMGPVAVPPLVDALKRTPQRPSALAALELLGASARDAIPALMSEVDCAGWHFRVEGEALLVLTMIGEDAIPPLVEATKSPRWWTRQAAAEGLNRLSRRFPANVELREAADRAGREFRQER